MGSRVRRTICCRAFPGDRWEYGINIDYAGKAVEAVSGQNLAVYLREHLFQPLGMKDTGFVIGPDQKARLVSVHARKPDGGLDPIEFGIPQEPAVAGSMAQGAIISPSCRC